MKLTSLKGVIGLIYKFNYCLFIDTAVDTLSLLQVSYMDMLSNIAFCVFRWTFVDVIVYISLISVRKGYHAK